MKKIIIIIEALIWVFMISDHCASVFIYTLFEHLTQRTNSTFGQSQRYELLILLLLLFHTSTKTGIKELERPRQRFGNLMY